MLSLFEIRFQLLRFRRQVSPPLITADAISFDGQDISRHFDEFSLRRRPSAAPRAPLTLFFRFIFRHDYARLQALLAAVACCAMLAARCLAAGSASPIAQRCRCRFHTATPPLMSHAFDISFHFFAFRLSLSLPPLSALTFRHAMPLF